MKSLINRRIFSILPFASLLPSGQKTKASGPSSIPLGDAVNRRDVKFPKIEWVGESLSAHQILAQTEHRRAAMSEIERLQHISFAMAEVMPFGTAQWPEDVCMNRAKQGRPCLTENRIIMMLGRKSTQASLDGRPLTQSQENELAVALSLLNGDAQRMHNLNISAIAEMIRDTRHIECPSCGQGLLG